MTVNRRLRRSPRLGSRSGRPARWPTARAAITIASVVFLTLAGTGVAQAVWTAAAVNPTASVSSGAVSISQTGFAALATTYDSTTLEATKSISVINEGVPSHYTLTLGSLSSAPDSFAGTVSLRTWPIAGTGTCASAPPTGATDSTWARGETFTGSLGAGATVRFCVQTSLASATSGSTMTARVDLRADVGSWSSSLTRVTAIQRVAHAEPRTLAAVSQTDKSVTLSWEAPEDSTVQWYQVYRDSIAVSSVQSATTFTDTGLHESTPYKYSVAALDNNKKDVLAQSSELTVTTDKRAPVTSPVSGKWYHVVTAAGTCVDAAAPSASTTELSAKECVAETSKFSFVADASAYKIVANSTATERVWESKAREQGGSTLTLGKEAGGGPKQAEQRFILKVADAAAGTLQIRRGTENSPQCLQSGTSLTMQVCDTTVPIQQNQQFTLVEVTP